MSGIVINGEKFWIIWRLTLDLLPFFESYETTVLT